MKRLSESRLQEIITKAVEQGIKAGYEAANKENAAKADKKNKFDAYRATEDRLYSLPILQKRILDSQERLGDLEEYPHLPGRSTDILRFKRAGVRLSEDEIVGGLKQDLKAQIAADQHEIKSVQGALEMVKDDEHYLCLSGRYFSNQSDRQIAQEIPCDESTVWRHRKRLVKGVAVRLYGVAALR